MIFSHKIAITSSLVSLFICLSALSLSAEPKKKKSPEVIANVVEVHDDHLMVITTKGKVVTRKIGLDKTVIFLHTGGSPSIFSYAPAITSSKNSSNTRFDKDVSI